MRNVFPIVFLLTRLRSPVPSLKFCFLMFALPLRETSCHATSRMAAVRCAFGMGTCVQGSEAAIGEVVSCSPSNFRRPLAFRAVEAHSSKGCQFCPPGVQAEPHARCCSFRGSGRGQEVGSSDPRCGQCPCQGSPRSSTDCPGQEQVAPGGGGGVV